MRLKIELENKSIPLLITPEGDYIFSDFEEVPTSSFDFTSYEWGKDKYQDI